MRQLRRRSMVTVLQPTKKPGRKAWWRKLRVWPPSAFVGCFELVSDSTTILSASGRKLACVVLVSDSTLFSGLSRIALSDSTRCASLG
eukprot:2831225-Rhodomonas_salina.1